VVDCGTSGIPFPFRIEVVLGKVDGGVSYELVYEAVYGAGAESHCIYIENVAANFIGANLSVNVAVNSIEKTENPIVNLNTTSRGHLSQSTTQFQKWRNANYQPLVADTPDARSSPTPLALAPSPIPPNTNRELPTSCRSCEAFMNLLDENGCRARRTS